MPFSTSCGASAPPGPHSRERRPSGELIAGSFKAGVQFGPDFTERGDRAIERLFSLGDPGVNFLLVSNIEGNRHTLARIGFKPGEIGRISQDQRICAQPEINRMPQDREFANA